MESRLNGCLNVINYVERWSFYVDGLEPETKQHIDSVLVERWASVADGGPTLNQQRVNVMPVDQAQIKGLQKSPYNKHTK